MKNEEIYSVIKDYFKNKPVKKISVIGSYATGTQKPDSDIDLIIELENPVGLFELARYKMDLEDLLNLKVDLATEKGISDHAYNYVRESMKPIYVA